MGHGNLINPPSRDHQRKTSAMSSKPIQPLYTTVPWSPSNFQSEDQEVTAQSGYPHPTYISPIDAHAQQFIRPTEIHSFASAYQLDSSLISPITPGLVAPAPTPEVVAAYPTHQQITYPQYPTESPWSTCSTHQQLLIPQYPNFPSTIFTYPQTFSEIPHYTQPRLQPQQHDFTFPHYTVPINTQQNATEDLSFNLHNNHALAYAYSTSFRPIHPFHDTFQHEALAPPNNGSISIGREGGVEGYKEEEVGLEMVDPRLNSTTEINQSSITVDANPIDTIDRNSISDQSNMFRFQPAPDSFPAEPESMPTIDPKLSSWGKLMTGGKSASIGASEVEGGGGTTNVDGVDHDHDRISVIPSIPPSSNGGNADPPNHDHAHDHKHVLVQDQDQANEDGSPSKRGRWSSSILSKRTTTTTKTTPLRKKRPLQLHLPPPSSDMRIPIATTHSAPAASFSLDLGFPSQSHRTDTVTTVPQEPPRVVGWVSPDERPVPPLGYIVPGFESVPKIFEYGHNDQVAVVPASCPAEPVCTNTNTEANDIPTPSVSAPPPFVFQHYEPVAIPRSTSDPQLRIPTASPPSPPAPYMLVPGLNGFEVAYWRPQTRTHTRHPDANIPASLPSIAPPTTAAPWEVSVPPMDPSLPPSTASSWESISTLDGHFIRQPIEAEPVVYLNHEIRNRGKTKAHPPRYHQLPQEKKETWVICEVCNATISRTSDLQVSTVPYPSVC